MAFVRQGLLYSPLHILVNEVLVQRRLKIDYAEAMSRCTWRDGGIEVSVVDGPLARLLGCHVDIAAVGEATDHVMLPGACESRLWV